MTAEDFIIGLFCRIDDQMKEIDKHYASESVPQRNRDFAVLFAIKGVGDRAFYRWLVRDWYTFLGRLYRKEPACFVCLALIKSGHSVSWLKPGSWVWIILTGIEYIASLLSGSQ